MMQYGETFVTASNPDFIDFFNINDPKTAALLDGILLNRTKGLSGNQYSFIHKTILEHFATEAGQLDVQRIVDGALSGNMNV